MMPGPGSSPEARAAIMCTGAQDWRVSSTGLALVKATSARVVRMACFILSWFLRWELKTEDE